MFDGTRGEFQRWTGEQMEMRRVHVSVCSPGELLHPLKTERDFSLISFI